MVEILLLVGSALGLSLFASEGRAVGRQSSEDRERGREEERRTKLVAVRRRMALLESDAGRTRALPELADEYDLLVLEERILEADEL